MAPTRPWTCAANTGLIPCTALRVYIPKAGPITPCRAAGSPQPEAVATSVRLYPNPTTGTVAVQSDVPTVYQWVKVLNLHGRTVLDQKADSASGIRSFDVRDLPAGLYEVQLFDGKQLTTQRLQKE